MNSLPVAERNPSSVEFKAPRQKFLFASFDGGVHSVGELQKPDRYRYWDQKNHSTPCIARGAGLSYSAASFARHVLSVSHESFDRVTDFNSSDNIVEVEAGISLYSLYRFLYSRQLYLPIQPGHGRITVGGCIAADVHGKNHSKDGTFMNQVESLTLFHPTYGLLELSRKSNPDLFRLTCGGYGLTGHIIRARLRAIPIPSSEVRIKAISFLEPELGFSELASSAAKADFAYTWHDMSTLNNGFGSGYVFEGLFLGGQNKENEKSMDLCPRLTSIGRESWRLPFINFLTVRLLNKAYKYQHLPTLNGRMMSLEDALFPSHRVQSYFKLFGAKGFYEYQAILPQNLAPEYFKAIHSQINQQYVSISLASAKSFSGPRELLRFSGAGICIALNFPRNDFGAKFMSFLDERILEFGGVPNIIKDSRLSREMVDSCYPGANEFRGMLRAFDPKRIFRSELSERLGL